MSDVVQSQQRLLHDGWRVFRRQPGEVNSPGDIELSSSTVESVAVPGSLFASLGTAFIADGEVDNFDWWYVLDFSLDDNEWQQAANLKLERLAGLAEIWLNDIRLGDSESFFIPLSLDVSTRLRASNRLVIGFHSVNAFLRQRRPRPKWKTNLVDQQQLRWLRTSLLGYIPGWTPPTPALGLCGDITLTFLNHRRVIASEINTQLRNGRGVVNAKLVTSERFQSTQLQFGDQIIELAEQESSSQQTTYTACYTVQDPQLWWPHTHGEPHQYACQFILQQAEPIIVDAGKRGFREIQLETADRNWKLRINGRPVFARGACWTTMDISQFVSDKTSLRDRLVKAKDGNINMLRIGGTMCYETDDFYQICDELGIMVWQDFMFANMDYPVEDADFSQLIHQEVDYQLTRLADFCCVSVFCGGSEIQQQAAMFGMPAEQWSNEFFDTHLPQRCLELNPGVPYIPSTPYGGALPFHLSEGVTHFYGVGAYKKSIAASGMDKVKFTAECLGFSHVPEPQKVEALFQGNNPTCHSITWKRGVPRDGGAGWDFEDIRDHYLQQLFGLDPIELRSRDTPRYLALSRVVVGELMKQVFAHWRSPTTPCHGALVWFYQDIVAGAGWGILDHQGDEKSVYYYLKRAFAPFAAFLLDDGLDGLQALLINETTTAREVRVEIQLISTPNIVNHSYTGTLNMAAQSSETLSVDALLGHFTDANYQYRFGAMQHRLVTLRVCDAISGEGICDDVFFPQSMHLQNEAKVALQSRLIQQNDALYLELTSDSFLQATHLELSKVKAAENYFHLLPGVSKKIRLSPQVDCGDVVKGYVTALNLVNPVRLRVTLEAEHV